MVDENQQLPQTIEELDQLVSERKQEKQTSVFGYVVLSLILPPFTTVWVMYRAWKKGLLYRFVPVMTIVYTILFALYSWLLLSSPGAVSDVLGKNLQKQPVVPSGQNTIFVIMAIVLTIAGVIGGFYFRNKARKEGSLSTVMILILIFILILQFWVGFSELSFVSRIVNQSVGNIYEGL